jgi:hypothetical protein
MPGALVTLRIFMTTISHDSQADDVIDFWVYEYNLLKSKYNLLLALSEDMYVTLINEIGLTKVSKDYQSFISQDV